MTKFKDPFDEAREMDRIQSRSDKLERNSLLGRDPIERLMDVGDPGRGDVEALLSPAHGGGRAPEESLPGQIDDLIVDIEDDWDSDLFNL